MVLVEHNMSQSLYRELARCKVVLEEGCMEN
jgi:hypothetical protein